MFSAQLINLERHDIKYRFTMRDKSNCTIELVKDPKMIDQDAARTVLVESFIGEYEQYLTPQEVDKQLTSWRKGDHSVQKYYEDYFNTELDAFKHKHVHFWIQAYVDRKLAGWATFEREKSDPNALYMNLLVVHPAYQHKGIGANLVNVLTHLQFMPISKIHLLLRTKNQGGRAFYTKQGFASDATYKRDGNFVDMNLLEPLTWNNPKFQQKLESKELEIKNPSHNHKTSYSK